MVLEWWLSGRRLRQAIGSFSLATIAYMEFRSALFRLNSVQPVTVVGVVGVACDGSQTGSTFAEQTARRFKCGRKKEREVRLPAPTHSAAKLLEIEQLFSACVGPTEGTPCQRTARFEPFECANQYLWFQMGRDDWLFRFRV